MLKDHPDKAPHISLNLHCEIADILNAYTALVEQEGKLKGLHAYNAARPPHSEGLKYNAEHPGDIWMAKSGFGGTEYLLSGLHSEGVKRGLSLNKMAELTSWNPARRFGLLNKGDIAVGYDADLVLFDPGETFILRAADSFFLTGHSDFPVFLSV